MVLRRQSTLAKRFFKKKTKKHVTSEQNVTLLKNKIYIEDDATEMSSILAFESKK